MTNDRTWRWGGWLAASALVLGNLLLHRSISNVCDALSAHIGREAYECLSLAGIGALSAAGIAWLLRARSGPRMAVRPLLALAGLALVTAAAQRWLLVSNVELIHLPQFGLLAAVLMGVGVSPPHAWLSSTAAGVLDEAYQRLVIYPHVPNVSFDWNDIVLNAIGAAWAVVLFTGAPHGHRPDRACWLRRAALWIALAGLAVALWLAPPKLRAVDAFPYRLPTLESALTGRAYHVMPASEGIAALLVLWGLVSHTATAGRWPTGTDVDQPSGIISSDRTC